MMVLLQNIISMMVYICLMVFKLNHFKNGRMFLNTKHFNKLN